MKENLIINEFPTSSDFRETMATYTDNGWILKFPPVEYIGNKRTMVFVFERDKLEVKKE